MVGSVVGAEFGGPLRGEGVYPTYIACNLFCSEESVYTDFSGAWMNNQFPKITQDGKDGDTPFIGANGNWWIGTTDTGVKAAGQDGKDGVDGRDGKDADMAALAAQVDALAAGIEERLTGALAERMAAAEAQIAERLAEVKDGAPGRDGRDGEPGRDGIDGKDADPEVIRGMISLPT